MAKSLTTMTQEKKSSTVEMSRSALFSYMDQYDTDVQTQIMPEAISPEPVVILYLNEKNAIKNTIVCILRTGNEGFYPSFSAGANNHRASGTAGCRP